MLRNYQPYWAYVTHLPYPIVKSFLQKHQECPTQLVWYEALSNREAGLVLSFDWNAVGRRFSVLTIRHFGANNPPQLLSNNAEVTPTQWVTGLDVMRELEEKGKAQRCPLRVDFDKECEIYQFVEKLS